MNQRKKETDIESVPGWDQNLPATLLEMFVGLHSPCKCCHELCLPYTYQTCWSYKPTQLWGSSLHKKQFIDFQKKNMKNCHFSGSPTLPSSHPSCSRACPQAPSATDPRDDSEQPTTRGKGGSGRCARWGLCLDEAHDRFSMGVTTLQ